MNVLFFKPIGRSALWGKTLIKEYFHYDNFPLGIGQAWAFSGQPTESTVCINGPYKGLTLFELWNTHQELFGYKAGPFPVIISLVGPEEDLSIQVHPNSEYAKKHSLPSGKNEAWYFIEAKSDASIVYGHNAKDREDLLNYVEQNRWNELIRHLKVKKDDFVYLPASLLHALKAGSIVYEIQEATDVTYRFYDYQRKDEKGNQRQLHLQQAIECLSYDSSIMENKVTPTVELNSHYTRTTYITSEFFTVSKVEVYDIFDFKDTNYQLATVIKGQGKVDGKDISIGDNFLIPIDTKISLIGPLTLMMTTK